MSKKATNVNKIDCCAIFFNVKFLQMSDVQIIVCEETLSHIGHTPMCSVDEGAPVHTDNVSSMQMKGAPYLGN